MVVGGVVVVIKWPFINSTPGGGRPDLVLTVEAVGFKVGRPCQGVNIIYFDSGKPFMWTMKFQ